MTCGCENRIVTQSRAGCAWTAGVVPVASAADPLKLERGGVLRDASIAYESFGDPSADRVVLVCHALTGDAHAARGGSDRGGWWDRIIGPGKPIDTDRVRVVCSNVLGGCAGSTGPASERRENRSGGRTDWGPDFPSVTIGDMVAAQRRLLRGIGIDRPVTVVGGSIGGFQALEWALRNPVMTDRVAVIAAGAALGASGIAFNSLGRRAIVSDPAYAGGRYAPGGGPRSGLSIARGIAHLTYRAETALDAKFGRAVHREGPSGDNGSVPATIGASVGPAFEIERYLDYNGERFADRFDANSYLGLTLAMDAYDARSGRGSLRDAFGPFGASGGRLFAAGFSSDWLFPPAQTEELAHAARAAGVRASCEVFATDDGHDAFLLPHEAFEDALRRFVDDVDADDDGGPNESGGDGR